MRRMKCILNNVKWFRNVNYNNVAKMSRPMILNLNCVIICEPEELMRMNSLTDDNVQSRSNRIIHPNGGETDTVCRTCWLHKIHQEPLDTSWIVNVRVNKCFICTTLPAGMMPMCRWQGCSVTLRSFSERSASCWVRPIMPCIISLNIPSPPTHTTLLWTNTKASVMKPSPIELSCCNPLIAQWLHGARVIDME